MSPRPSGNAAAPAATAFKVDKVSLPGEGRGDYLTIDTDANRLYVTHSAAVHVLDLTTLKPLFQVDGLRAAHGVALDPARGHGFVTDGKQNAVVMFDLAAGKAIRTIPAGQKPDSIVHDLASGMVFAFNGESSDVSVIDPAKAAVVKTIKLPGGPEFSQADGLGKVWVNIEERNVLAEIDSKTLTLARTIKLDGCEGPGRWRSTRPIACCSSAAPATRSWRWSIPTPAGSSRPRRSARTPTVSPMTTRRTGFTSPIASMAGRSSIEADKEVFA